MSFEEALEKLNNDTYPNEGFYVTKKVSDAILQLMYSSDLYSGLRRKTESCPHQSS